MMLALTKATNVVEKARAMATEKLKRLSASMLIPLLIAANVVVIVVVVVLFVDATMILFACIYANCQVSLY